MKVIPAARIAASTFGLMILFALFVLSEPLYVDGDWLGRSTWLAANAIPWMTGGPCCNRA